ncbi:uncharacterized protein LOC131242039 [Magnolia sinica]|uniref:uncharacterized protein LOC131242039 n=1 Tax=Magnolia sinica TaxID=86752 RepID=UPI00265B6340|nr:uncharacterized protein LOC131242039 [Magnolia sinica]
MREGGGCYGKLGSKFRGCNYCKRWAAAYNYPLSSEHYHSHHKRHHSHFFFKAKRQLKKKFQYNIHAPPSAPLNTTSYLINSKSQYSPFSLSPPAVLDSYGSMKGLLALHLMTEENPALVLSPSNSRLVPKLLELRIRKRDERIAQIEEERGMMKERLICMEEELDGLKDRVRVLELSNAVRVVSDASHQASFS